MSQDEKDLPKTAGPNHASNKPAKGELFVRTKGGSVLLTQTKELGGVYKDPRTGA